MWFNTLDGMINLDLCYRIYKRDIKQPVPDNEGFFGQGRGTWRNTYEIIFVTNGDRDTSWTLNSEKERDEKFDEIMEKLKK